MSREKGEGFQVDPKVEGADMKLGKRSQTHQLRVFITQLLAGVQNEKRQQRNLHSKPNKGWNRYNEHFFILSHPPSDLMKRTFVKVCQRVGWKGELQFHCKYKIKPSLEGEKNLIMPFAHSTHYQSDSKETVSISITVP